MKKNITSIVASLLPVALLLLLGSGCSTMKVPPLKTDHADSYTQHEQKNGVVVGIRPMTDKREIKDMFKVNLLDKGVLPVLVVAENQSPAASFIIAKEQIHVREGVSQTEHPSQRKKVTSGSGKAVATTGSVLVACGCLVAAPLLFEGMQMESNASVIEFNLGDKEFYTRTLGPGEKAQGFVYVQLPGGSLPSGDYRLVARAKNAATCEAIDFDLPINLNFSK